MTPVPIWRPDPRRDGRIGAGQFAAHEPILFVPEIQIKMIIRVYSCLESLTIVD